MPTLVTRGAASVRGFGFAGTTPVLPDPYFNYTTLLLHGNGTNGGQNNTFQDSSTNNFTITRNGNTTQGTFSPFSQTGWSNYFDGSGDYLNTTSSANLNLGASNFTVEFWVNPSALTNEARMVTVEVTSSTTVGIIMGGGGAGGSNTDIQVNQLGTGTRISAASVLSVGSWFHVAVTYNGTTSTLWVNGVSKGTYSGNVYPNSNSYVTIGGSINYSNATFNGYLSNVRVLKGTCLYTTTFTPPTAPLTAITDTQLLTCQSNRFIDNSANQFTITVSGNTSVQAFSPFAPTAAYSASTVGGSGYFDGTGDYLNTGSNTAFALGTGDFTWEAWLYRTVSATQEIYTSMTTDGLIIYISGNAAVVKRFGVADLLTSSASIDLNTWTHIAVARSGTTLSMWINGSRSAGGTTTNSTNFAQSGLRIGINDVGSSAYTGYMSNLRVVKGTAVYDPTQTSITVPTAPLTNISNTSLLLNFTNAAIIDNTAKNVLETVGNAQISTTQSKFGGGSILCSTSSDYLRPPNSLSAAMSTGDFTIEFWFYASSLTTFYQPIIDTRNTGASATGFFIGLDASGKPDFYTNGADRCLNASAISTGQWYHIAVCRASGSTRLFINGVQGGSTYTDANNYSNQQLRIGTNFDASLAMSGYIDDLRITKGIARYTSNFTPQTSQWQDQ